MLMVYGLWFIVCALVNLTPPPPLDSGGSAHEAVVKVQQAADYAGLGFRV